MSYKIVNCKDYKSDKTVRKEWYEVQYLSNVRTWLFFGPRVWRTYKEKMGSFSGSFYVNLEFNTSEDAREFISRCKKQEASDKIIKEEVCEIT
jgi:hypothetical protein